MNPSTTNKQTQQIGREAVQLKIDNGQPITKAELSVYLGIGYSTVRQWYWLPMLGGLLFYDDFIISRQMHLGLLTDPRIVGHLQKHAMKRRAANPDTRL